MSESPKFPSKDAYLAWCAEQCQKIKVNCIAMNDAGIREAVHEIDRMLYLTDHQELCGPSNLDELLAAVEDRGADDWEYGRYVEARENIPRCGHCGCLEDDDHANDCMYAIAARIRAEM